MDRRRLLQWGGLAALTAGAGRWAGGQERFDLAIVGGRVMDPESGLDALRNVGISGGTIRAVSFEPLRGAIELDAAGLVVAPGFIDPIAHGQDLENNRYQVMDGVTTTLQLEGGTADVDGWYAEREGRRLLNYGVSVGHGAVRAQVLGADADRPATDAETTALRARVERELARGAVAVGFGLEYRPAVGRWEVLEMFRAAAAFRASCHVHLRYGAVNEPGSALEGAQEVLADATVTGAALQIVHVPSMGLRNTPRILAMIEQAGHRGLDVTGDCYPYTAFSTGIASAVFADGWQGRFGIDYGDLQWAETGERLTAESFARYRKSGGRVIAHAIPEEAVRAALRSPAIMVGSDGALSGGRGHPRAAGTFARVLGRYVREERVLALVEALRKMTLLPARRLERRVPALRRKGRLQVGADADITVFDPRRVIDRATYEDPARFSEGIRHVLVNGVPVVRDGRLNDGVMPGRAVRARLRDL